MPSARTGMSVDFMMSSRFISLFWFDFSLSTSMVSGNVPDSVQSSGVTEIIMFLRSSPVKTAFFSLTWTFGCPDALIA